MSGERPGPLLRANCKARCINCDVPIEWERYLGWVHVCTGERECDGYPYYGNRNARPAQ